MIILQYLIIVILLILGLLITLEDFKSGKIRNKWVRLGFFLGLIYFFISAGITILYCFRIVNFDFYPSIYYLAVFYNTFIAFVLGFALWHFKLWAGGDAKLFTFYVFLIPLDFYSNWYFKYWPALALMINIILPIFIYLLIKFLLYPIQLGINYLKNPQFLKEYYQKFKAKNKIDKIKFKGYLSFGISFLIILIFFQILRTRINEFLTPYLGQLIIVSYFLMGLVVFHPLRALLQKKVVLVTCLVGLYFIIGAIFFRQIAFADLHKLFALQFIVMMSYFYIFKYGKALGQFLYNSAEVKIVPVTELRAGVYINKEYIKQIFGSRYNYDDMKKELVEGLDTEEQSQLENYLKSRQSKDQMWQELILIFSNLRLDSLPTIIQQIMQYRKRARLEKSFLSQLKEKLSKSQWQKLQDLLNQADEVQKFLKSIMGKLSAGQAEQLKEMIEKRNEEIVAKGLVPVDKIILHKIFSFAPWMLLGVIITLLTKSSLLHLVYQYILHR